MKAKDTQRLKSVRRRSRVNENVLNFDPAYIKSQLNPETTNRRILKSFSKILSTAIEQELTPRQQEIVRLRYYENMTYKGISDQLGIAPTTVSRTLHRAESRIRKSLKYCLLLLRAFTEEDNDDD